MIPLGTLLVSSEVIAGPENADQDGMGIQRLSETGIIEWWPIPAAVVALAVWLKLPDTRLRQPRLRRWSFSPYAGLFLFIASILGGLLAVSVARAVMDPPRADDPSAASLQDTVISMMAMYLGQGVVLLLVPGLVLGARQFVHPERRPLSGVRTVFASVGGLAIFWPLVAMSGILTGLVVSAITGDVLPEVAHDTLARLQQAALHPDLWFWIILVLLVVATPFFEEAIYRGLLQESLRRLPMFEDESPWVAILATSVIFSAMHAAVVDYRGLVALIVLSMGFGWIMLRTGRLLAAVVMHGLFNALNLLEALG